MRKYEYISKGGIYCYGKIEDLDVDKKRVITYVYHILSDVHGDLHKGNFLKFGIHRIGSYYMIDGKIIGAIEEPIYYK